MTYRDDVAALAARQVSLENDLAAKTRELDAATRLLDEAKEKARLPILPNIHVASPCPADWNAMTGDERVRMCASCNKHVFNLSNMTREEAENVIIEQNGKLCVQYFQRKDGTILLKDCTVGASAARKRKLIAAGAAAMVAGGAFAAWKTHRRDEDMSGIDIVVQPESAELSVHEQEKVREPAPPPAPVVLEIPKPLIDQEEWHHTGGAIAISVDPADLDLQEAK